MHRTYCTLFDSKYAERGLALYESLRAHSSEPFTLHVLAMDAPTFWLLDALDLEGVSVLALHSFEKAMHLEPVRQSRSWAEYCWTAASSLMEYLMMATQDLGELTYLDADLFFFNDPKVIFTEMSGKGIGIVPHRFPVERKHMERNGIYNVGWVTFRKIDTAMRCLARWAAQTREWCFHRNDGDRFGDQKYLDSWPSDYPTQVAVLENLGVGLAPWNIGNYRMTAGPCANGYPVVFYHFHEYQSPSKLTNYTLRVADVALIYQPYIRSLQQAAIRIEAARNIMTQHQNDLRAQGERA